MTIRFRGALVAAGVLTLAVASAEAQEVGESGPQAEPAPQVAPGEAQARSEAQTQAETRSTYTVRRGDTLSGIARRHGVDTRELARQNGIRNANRIRAGQELVVPGRGRAQGQASQGERAREQARDHQSGAGGAAGMGERGGPEARQDGADRPKRRGGGGGG